MPADPETRALETWQDSLVPELLSRLLRPLSRPGIISLVVTRRIVGWLSYLDGRISLATEIARRRGRGAGLLSNPVPIVHARWMFGTESRAEVGEALKQREPAKELPVVRATATLAGGEAPRERALRSPSSSMVNNDDPGHGHTATAMEGGLVTHRETTSLSEPIPMVAVAPPIEVVYVGTPVRREPTATPLPIVQATASSPSPPEPTPALVRDIPSSSPVSFASQQGRWEHGRTATAMEGGPVAVAVAGGTPPVHVVFQAATASSPVPTPAVISAAEGYVVTHRETKSLSEPIPMVAVAPPIEVVYVGTPVRREPTATPLPIVQATASSPPEPTPALVRDIPSSSPVSFASQQGRWEHGRTATGPSPAVAADQSYPEPLRKSGHDVLVAAAPEQTAVVHAAAPITPPSEAIVTPVTQPTLPRSFSSSEMTSRIIMPPARRRQTPVRVSPATPPILEREGTQLHAPERMIQAHPQAFEGLPVLGVDSPSPAVPSSTINEHRNLDQDTPRPVVIGRPAGPTGRDASSGPERLPHRTAEERRVSPKRFTPPTNAEQAPSPTPARRGALPVVTPAIPGLAAPAPAPRPALLPGVSAASAPLPRALARPTASAPVSPRGGANITPALGPPPRNLPTAKAAAPAESPRSPAAPAIAPAGRANVDIDALADKVQRKILRQLAAERERKGSLR